MYRKANNVFAALLDDSAVTTLPAVADVVTAANLGNGAVVLTDMGLRRLDSAAFTALANGEGFMIVQGRGANNPLMKSPKITKGAYTTSIQNHVAAQQQVTVFGYTGPGSTETMPSANDTSYYIKVRKNDNDEGNRSQPFSLFGQYGTGGAASVTEVAFGVARNLIANMADEAPATNGYLSVEVLSDGTLTALPNNANVVSGSNVVSSTAHALTAGDFVNLAGATYEVKAVLDANTFTLTMPYVGATATITAGGTLGDAGTVTNITLTGIRLTGIESDFSVDKFRNYFANRFTATFNDEDTAVTHVAGAFNGSGVWQQVANDEYMNYGYEGMNEMISIPPKARDQVVKIPGVGSVTAVDAKYSTLNIKWDENINTLVTKHGGAGNVIVHVNLTDDGAGNGELAGTGSTGETLVAALGLTAGDFNE